MKWTVLRYDDFRSLELWAGVVESVGLEYSEEEDGPSPKEITIFVDSAEVDEE